jgi:hypothetical protein
VKKKPSLCLIEIALATSLRDCRNSGFVIVKEPAWAKLPEPGRTWADDRVVIIKRVRIG